VLGCSTGYGLASRIVATFAGGADTIGVSLEREPSEKRSARAGWYNNRAFEIEARRSDDRRSRWKATLSPRHEEDLHRARARESSDSWTAGLQHGRAGPHRSRTRQDLALGIKPLGRPVEIKTLNTEPARSSRPTIAPASEDEAAHRRVMGGDDWKRWIEQLATAGVLAPGFRTLNYTYIGS
jgi:enoyl-[acyl-carrier protein] reductase/trans-2-enoyl-CoA reductase (NAD+)